MKWCLFRTACSTWQTQATRSLSSSSFPMPSCRILPPFFRHRTLNIELKDRKFNREFILPVMELILAAPSQLNNPHRCKGLRQRHFRASHPALRVCQVRKFLQPQFPARSHSVHRSAQQRKFNAGSAGRTVRVQQVLPEPHFQQDVGRFFDRLRQSGTGTEVCQTIQGRLGRKHCRPRLFVRI